MTLSLRSPAFVDEILKEYGYTKRNVNLPLTTTLFR